MIIFNMRSKIHYHLYFISSSVADSFRKSSFAHIFQMPAIVLWQTCFCLTISALLCNGKFHKHLQEIFVPLVVRYVDLMESSIAQSIHRGFEQETWQPVKYVSCLVPIEHLPPLSWPVTLHMAICSYCLWWTLPTLFVSLQEYRQQSSQCSSSKSCKSAS